MSGAPGPRRPLEDAGAESLAAALRTSFRLLQVMMIVVVLLYLGSGFFKVQSGEQAIVLRFGRVVGPGDGALLEEGLHWSFPFPVDEVLRYPVARQPIVDVDTFRYAKPPGLVGEESNIPKGLIPGRDGHNITANSNIIHTSWSVQYRLTDPIAFFKRFGGPEALEEGAAEGPVHRLLRAAVNNAVVRVIGATPVDAALYTATRDLNESVAARVARHVSGLDVGLEVTRVQLRDIVPPRQCREEFELAKKADEEREKAIQQAQGRARVTRETAKGEAARILARAEGYASRVVSSASRDAKAMGQLLAAYPGEPGKLRPLLERMHVEAVEDFLSAVDEVTVARRGPGDDIWVLISRDPQIARERDKLRRDRERDEELERFKQEQAGAK